MFAVDIINNNAITLTHLLVTCILSKAACIPETSYVTTFETKFSNVLCQTTPLESLDFLNFGIKQKTTIPLAWKQTLILLIHI